MEPGKKEYVYLSAGTNLPKKMKKVIKLVGEVIKDEGNVQAYVIHEREAKKLAAKASYKGYFDSFMYAGRLVLHHAAAASKLFLVDMLVHILGVPIDLQDNTGAGVLHHCISAEQTSAAFMKILVEQYNAHVDLQDYSSTTPLHKSIMSGNIAATEALLDLGADPDMACFYGKAIHAACAKKNLLALNALISKGANIDEGYYYFLNPAAVAVYFGATESRCTHTGANVNAKHLVAKAIIADVPESEMMIQMLVQNGADANGFDETNHEELPIILAAKRGKWEIVEFLLAYTEPISGVTWDVKGITEYINTDDFKNQDEMTRKKRADALRIRVMTAAKRNSYMVGQVSCKALKHEVDDQSWDLLSSLCEFCIRQAIQVGKVKLDNASLRELCFLLMKKEMFANVILTTKAMLALYPDDEIALQLLKSATDAEQGVGTSGR